MSDIAVTRYIESVKTYRAEGQFEKAIQVIDEAMSQGIKDAGLANHLVGISLQRDGWKRVLDRIVSVWTDFDLSSLCGGTNRKDFLKLVREYSGFRTGLMEHLFQLEKFDGFYDWVALSETNEQHWLVKSWLQLAENSGTGEKAAIYYTAVGAGLFAMDDWDNAWLHWAKALGNNPGLLQKITALCKNSPKVDLRKPGHRLRIIHLIAAAGKRKESMSLLLALALENRKNAKTIFSEMPPFLPFGRKSKEVIELRLSIALYLQDPEALFLVISEMDNCSSKEVFHFRKNLTSKIKNAPLQRATLFRFVKLYISQKDWESAASLLESLYKDDPSGDVIESMEYVVSQYPVMPQLNYTVGKHYLRTGDPDKAAMYYRLLVDIRDYQKGLKLELKDFLSKAPHEALTFILLSCYPPGSHKACAIAFYTILHLKGNCGNLVELLISWKTRKQPSPYWYFGMLYGSYFLEEHDQAYELLCKFLMNYAKLTPEVLRIAELIAAKYGKQPDQIIQIIDTFANTFKPKEHWVALKDRFIQNMGKSEDELDAGDDEDDALDIPDFSEDEDDALDIPDFSEDDLDLDVTRPDLDATIRENLPVDPQFEKLHSLIDEGHFEHAGEFVVKLVHTHPERLAPVLAKLNELIQNYPHQVVFPRVALQLLVESQSWELAVKIGQTATLNPNYQGKLVEIYQYLAHAYSALKDEKEALRFYCLAARDDRYFTKNIEVLVSRIFPDHMNFLKDVLQLVLNRGDENRWEQLMAEWNRYRPGEITKLLKAHVAFSNKVNTPRSYLGLASWFLQAGNLEEVNQTLSKVNLDDSEIRDALIHVANFAQLKNPDDHKPKFVLARYYLLHGEVPKAVDTFRKMTKGSPDSAEPVFQFVRTYLKKSPKEIDSIYLYGLLIRITLSYGSALAAIKLLEEFGEHDQDGANSLTDGVIRVLLARSESKEVYYELARIHYVWRSYGKVMKIHERIDFGSHMAEERLSWFEHMVTVSAEYREPALLAQASLHFELAQFKECRFCLTQLRSYGFRRQGLNLYDRLTERFPDDMDLWREAGWTAYPATPKKAIHYFKTIFEHSQTENHLEAYGILRELGANPDFERIANLCGDEDRLYQALREVYIHLRELELDQWEQEGEVLPVHALEWLLNTGQLGRFRAFLGKIREEGQGQLEARYFKAIGQSVAAAWRLSTTDAPTIQKQDFFFDAGMEERAILMNPKEQRLPQVYRREVKRNFGHPRMIFARASRMKAIHQEARATRDINEPMI